MSIPTIPLAGTEKSISRLGFGCARIFGGSELRTARRLIEAALSSGIRHFDTAPSYGGGTSEAALGDVLRDVADVTVATKVGIPRPAAPSHKGALYRQVLRPVLTRFPAVKASVARLRSRPSVVAGPVARRVLKRDEVLRSLEDSLRHLRRNTIDVFFVHEPDQFELDDASLELFEGLRRAGTISAFGLASAGTPSGAAFGSVIQGRFDAAGPVTKTGAVTVIFHGVVRQAKGRLETGGATRTLLDSFPSAGVVFSASSERQINEIARAFSTNEKIAP